MLATVHEAEDVEGARVGGTLMHARISTRRLGGLICKCPVLSDFVLNILQEQYSFDHKVNGR